MTGEADDIVQNIVFTGNGEITEAFNKIQEAGQRAFDGVSRSLESSASSLGRFGIVAGATAAAVGAIGVGIFTFVKQVEETVSSLSNLADQTGTTLEQISGLRAAFAAGGIGAGQMESAFKRLSVTVQQSWQEIKQASAESADKLKGNAVSIAQAILAVADAQQKLTNTSRDQAFQASQNANSVAGAQQRVDELRVARLKSQGFDTSVMEAQLQIQRQINAENEAELQLKQAKAKAADDAANAEANAQKAALSALQAQLTLNQAIRKEREDQRNDINNIIAAVEQVAQGNNKALNNINATAENIVKGIIGAVGKSRDALGQLRGDITDLASPAPEVRKVFDTLGSVLAGLADPATRTAVAFRFLGRTVTQEFINIISDKSKLKEFQDRVESLGLSITEVDKIIDEKFRTTLFTMQNDLQLISVKIASAFGPALTQLLEGLDAAIINSKNGFIDFAKTIGESVLPAMESFARVMKGAPDAVKDDWLVRIINTFKLFGDTVGSVVDLVTTSINGLTRIIDFLISSVNKLAGTDLTPLSIAISVVTGPLRAFAEVVKLAADSLREIFELLGANGGEAQGAAFDRVAAKLRLIKELLTGDVKKAFDDYQKTIDTIQDKMQDLEDESAKSAKAQQGHAEETAKAHKNAHEQIAQSGKDAYGQVEQAAKSAASTQQQSAKIAADANTKTNEEIKKTALDIAKAQQNTGVVKGPGGVTTITPGVASQKSINDALGLTASTRPQDITSETQRRTNDAIARGDAQVTQALRTSQELEKRFQEQTALLKKDFDSQKELNQNFEKFTGHRAGTANEKFTDFPQVSRSYPPGVRGHYDQNMNFVPDVPTQRLQNSGAILPTTNEFSFGGQKNPFPYVPGISTPLSFPTYNAQTQARLDAQNIPIPRPRPEDLDATAKAVQMGVQAAEQADRQQNQPAVPLTSAQFPPQQFEQPPLPTPPPLSPDLQSSLLGDFQSTIGNLLDGIKNLFAPSQTQPTQDLPPTQDLTSVSGSLQTAASGVDSAGSSLVSAISGIASQIGSISFPQPGAAQPQAPITAALGGLISGIGGEMSDSNLAWLSRNEFVQPARATRHYGVAFMESIRSLSFPRFADGGLAFGDLLPRFADGGLATGGGGGLPRLGVADFRTNGGDVRVVMQQDSFAALQRRATTSRMTSTSKRKPGFVG